MNPACYTAYPRWAEQEYIVGISTIGDLKRDVDGINRDIAGLKTENIKNRTSIIKLDDIMGILQDQHNGMLQKYKAAKARVIELESELATLRAVNKKMSKKAKLVRERSRSRSRSDPRRQKRDVPRQTPIVVTMKKPSRFQVPSHPCFNHPNCIIVDDAHGSL